METIIVRYGELALKAKNTRKRFEQRLLSNINAALGKQSRARLDYGRVFVETNNTKEAINKLTHVFGIVSFSQCTVADAKMESILDKSISAAKKHIKKGDSFAVKTNRVGEHNFTSEKINKELGSLIIKELGNKVNLSKPDKTISIDIRNKKAYIYTHSMKGPGGLPVGVEGKVAVLLKNKKDLAAAWIAMKRGCEIVPIFLKNIDHNWLKAIKEWSHGFEIETETIKSMDLEELEKIIKRYSLLGVFVGEKLEYVDELKKLKTTVSVPIYTPLVCLPEENVNSILLSMDV